MSFAEAFGALLVLIPASLMLAGYLLDLAGLPIAPLPTLLGGAAIASAIWWPARRPFVRQPKLVDLATCLVLVAGVAGYLLWLAGRSQFPLAHGPDFVHHLSLIQFIAERRMLVHDPRFEPYLGEMIHYTPGSHILAAIVAALVGIDPIRVIHPVLAAMVSLKIGLLYLIVRRITDVPQAIAAAGAMLVILPHSYLIGSFTSAYFYAQVVSETFAVAMLWALVVWHQTRAAWVLALFSIFGIGVFLAWPVWLPVPVLTLMALMLLEPDQENRGLRWRRLALALLPIAAIVALQMKGRVATSSILSVSGGVIQPTMQIVSWPFAVLAAAGVAVALKSDRARPVLMFGAACIVQTIGLAALDVYKGVDSFYMPYKMAHLLLYPLGILAAVALAWMWRQFVLLSPATLRVHESAVALVVPALLLVPIRARLRPYRPRPVASETVYDAASWTRTNLPHQCVDYLVDDWLTAYWLHINVLGNPRMAARTREITETFEPHMWMGRWIGGETVPFALVEDLQALPNEIRSNVRVRHVNARAAVIERVTGGVCEKDGPTLGQLPGRR